MATDEGHSSENFSQMFVLRQLNSFIRKPPSQEGLGRLSQLAEKSDTSYCSVLLNAAVPYLREALGQWTRLSQDSRNAALAFLALLSTKIEKTGVQGLIGRMKRLKGEFSKKLGKGTAGAQNKVCPLHLGDEQEFLREENVMVEKDDRVGEQGVAHRLRPELKLRERPELSRMEILKELNFKAELKNLQSSAEKESNKQEEEGEEDKEEQAEQLQNYVSNHRDCVTCLSWVKETEDLSFPLPQQPIAFFGPLSSLPDFKEDLLQQLVAFLNTKGGAILLGCKEEQGGKVLAFRENITENMKQNIENRLQNWIEGIYPPVTLKRQLDLNWIPVGQPTQFKKGGFLLRIAIEPTDPSTTYFYSTSTPKFAEQTPNGPLEITKEPVYKLMQTRFFSAQNNRNVNGLRERGNWAPVLPLHFGPCQPPEKGRPEYQGPLIGPGVGVVEKRENNKLLEGRQTFKNVSLLVVSEGGKKAVEEMVRKGEKIDVLIEKAFPDKKFWLGSTTWLLWHSVKYEKVITGIKKDMKNLSKANEGKPPLLISTCGCLKVLDDPLEEEQIEELVRVGRKESGEEVKHSFMNEYDYFQCENCITAVYLYFYLNDKYRIKSVFEKPNANNPQKHKHTRKNKNGKLDNDKPEKPPLKDSPKSRNPPSGNQNKLKVEEPEQEQKREVPAEETTPPAAKSRAFLCCYVDQYSRKFCYYDDWIVEIYDASGYSLGSRYYNNDEYNQAWSYASMQQGNNYYQ